MPPRSERGPEFIVSISGHNHCGDSQVRPRILVADDDLMNRMLLERILTSRGYEAESVVDGVAAVARARRELPDLILLDVMMPGKDGYQVCQELKEVPRFAEIPIIFLSARTNATDRVKGLKLGAADYINKPFNVAEVIARVNCHLKISALTRQLQRANQELIDYQNRIEKDLLAARKIQACLLPNGKQIAEPWLKMDWRFLPCDKVGGDIFNVFWLDREHLGAYVIDVSGHGVPSAMVTVALSRSLSPETGYSVQPSVHRAAKRIVSPREVLWNLDREYPFERFGKFFSISYLVLNCRTGHLRFSSAGHPPPFLIRTDGMVSELDAGGTLIGIGIGVDFEEGTTDLQKGDRIFLYTDGITERANAEGELFGIERLREKLTAIPRAGLASLLDGLMVTLDSFAAHQPAPDDITICALEFTKKLEANERT